MAGESGDGIHWLNLRYFFHPAKNMHLMNLCEPTIDSPINIVYNPRQGKQF